MDVNKITEEIIGAAIEVYRVIGPGQLEDRPAYQLQRACFEEWHSPEDSMTCVSLCVLGVSVVKKD